MIYIVIVMEYFWGGQIYLLYFMLDLNSYIVKAGPKCSIFLSQPSKYCDFMPPCLAHFGIFVYSSATKLSLFFYLFYFFILTI